MPVTQFTLNDTNVHNIFKMLTGADATVVAGQTIPTCLASCRKRTLANISTGGQTIYEGDGSVSSANGLPLSQGSSDTAQSDLNGVSLTERFVVASATGAKLSVDWEYA